jgi:hypothetical protein
MVTSFPEIAGLAIDNIRSSQCRLNTPPDRPRHPISRIAPRPAILGYARERVLIYGRIVGQHARAVDQRIACGRRCSSRCPAANVVRYPRHHDRGEERCCEGPRKGDVAPRTVEKFKKGQKISYFRHGSAVKRASPRSGLSATHGRKPHPALFKVSLHDCVGGRGCG